VAVADVKEQFASQTARRYGYERAESSWQAVAEADDVDVVSRVAAGLPNSLGFELFTSGGAATFDLARPGEFGLLDFTPPGPVNGYRQVLIGSDHPYIAGGMAMDFPSVNYGQNDLFVWQCRAFLEQVAGVTGGLPPVPSLAHGLHNMRLLSAVAESAKNNGADVAVA
jgi:predicted dehydrogenase